MCPFHKGDLGTTNKWKNLPQRPPRKLYDRNGPVYLVSRIYECYKENSDKEDGRHEIVSTDEGILQQLYASYPVPFFLTHIAGVTEELRSYISLR
jgi:hypothetical protein